MSFSETNSLKKDNLEIYVRLSDIFVFFHSYQVCSNLERRLNSPPEASKLEEWGIWKEVFLDWKESEIWVINLSSLQSISKSKTINSMNLSNKKKMRRKIKTLLNNYSMKVSFGTRFTLTSVKARWTLLEKWDKTLISMMTWPNLSSLPSTVISKSKKHFCFNSSEASTNELKIKSISEEISTFLL